MKDERNAGRFEKHPWFWNTVLVVISLSVSLLALEVFLRYMIDFRIDYYAGRRQAHNTVLHFPYGQIPINSHGEADAEFDLASAKKRIGYFGDSVNFGVGAGYPYRVSDLLEDALPEYEHWNVGSESGAGIPLYMPDKIRKYNLSYAIYLLNLNDISPAASNTNSTEEIIGSLVTFTKRSVDFLRDKSYVYSFIRFEIKNALTVWFGFNASGYVAYELWPSRYKKFFKLAAERINEVATETKRTGAALCIIILPYEMQISRPAADAYKSLGFQWEDDFLSGKAQSLLKEWLDPFISVHDPRSQFAPHDSPVGTYFVYNKGDKIDWNHPNREGHRIIAESFLNSDDCPLLTGTSGRFEPAGDDAL